MSGDSTNNAFADFTFYDEDSGSETDVRPTDSIDFESQQKEHYRKKEGFSSKKDRSSKKDSVFNTHSIDRTSTTDSAMKASAPSSSAEVNQSSAFPTIPSQKKSAKAMGKARAVNVNKDLPEMPEEVNGIPRALQAGVPPPISEKQAAIIAKQIKRKPVPTAQSTAAAAAEQQSTANASPQKKKDFVLTRPHNRPRQPILNAEGSKPQPLEGEIFTINRSESGRFHTTNIVGQEAATFVPPTNPNPSPPFIPSSSEHFADPEHFSNAPNPDLSPKTRQASFGAKVMQHADKAKDKVAGKVAGATDALVNTFHSLNKKADEDNSSTSSPRKPSVVAEALGIVRRWSNNVKDSAKDLGQILAAAPDARQQLQKQKFAEQPNATERESARRVDPYSRTPAQQQYILNKNLPRGRKIAFATGDVRRDFIDMVENEAMQRRQYESAKDKWIRDVQEADKYGRTPPPRPICPMFADLELSPTERAEVRAKAAESVDPLLPTKKTLPVMQTIAFNASGMLDPLKTRTKRTATMETEMSFADVLSPEQAAAKMHPCSQCGRPPKNYLLQDGRCRDCHLKERDARPNAEKIIKGPASPLLVTTDVIDFAPRHSSQSVDAEADSPPFMKVAAAKKLRKVRQTIYEDPGNPFDVADSTDQVPLLPIPFRPSLQKSQSELTSRIETAKSGKHRLLTGSPFADAIESPVVLSVPKSGITFVTTLHAPTPHRQVAPALVKKAHRSVSVVAIPWDAAVGLDPEGEYVAPRAGWRRGSVPVPVSGGGDGDVAARYGEERSVRDTQFYGFYDDLLPEYGKRSVERGDADG
ncbi:hypothetical protein LTR12_006815 [Friedmanniomyces endolithicus]|nr:hypothetical protein LTR12_006815 [Friedmanniomyces endolithicus]